MKNAVQRYFKGFFSPFPFLYFLSFILRLRLSLFSAELLNRIVDDDDDIRWFLPMQKQKRVNNEKVIDFKGELSLYLVMIYDAYDKNIIFFALAFVVIVMQ